MNQRRGQSWQRRSIPRLRPGARRAARRGGGGCSPSPRRPADGGAGRHRGEHRAAVGAAGARLLATATVSGSSPPTRWRSAACCCSAGEAGRPARPQADLHGRRRPVSPPPQRSAGAAPNFQMLVAGRAVQGAVRRAARARGAGAAHHDVHRAPGAARGRSRIFGAIAGSAGADRPAARRPARPSHSQLAVDALRQPGLRRPRGCSAASALLRRGEARAPAQDRHSPARVPASAGLFALVYGLLRRPDPTAGHRRRPVASLTGAGALLAACRSWQTQRPPHRCCRCAVLPDRNRGRLTSSC